LRPRWANTRDGRSHSYSKHIPTLNGRQYTGVKGLNLREDNAVIRFETPTITPTVTSGERLLYVNSSNQLIFQDGSSSTTLGGVGGGATPTFETLFAADATLTLTPDVTFTIAGNRATATDVLTITNIGGGSGDCLQITNSGSGNDISGTSGLFAVAATGVVTAAGFVSSATSAFMSTTGAAVWTLKDNDASALTFDASGSTGQLVFDTRNGAEVLSTAATIFKVSAGQSQLTNASNTVATVLVTNNTASTFGADADSAGVCVIRSTSLTTGSLLKLQLTEGTLNGGFYLCARDVTAGANIFTIGEDGAHVIAGAGGSDMLTVTAGDLVVSDGSLTMTDADNAATLSITNSTATSASVFVFAGAGTFTGTTTTSFMTLTPSGLTSGTALYLPVAALDTGRAIHVVANALTSGIVMNVTSSATAITGAGRLFLSTHSGATGTSAVLNEFISAANDETVVLQVKGSSLLAGGKLLHLSAAAATTGTILDISDNTAHTTGKAVNVVTNSADTGTRSTVYIKQDHASASGATVLELVNDGALPPLKVTAAATSTNYYPLLVGNGVTIWMGAGTTANGNLTGTAGDICLNAGSNKPEYCTGTTNWTALV
jgi:hypothetical protein